MLEQGIFVTQVQKAANTAGPALKLFPFVIAAFSGVIISFLCYAEFASRVPNCCGAYGVILYNICEIVGWLVGWLLIW